MSLYPPWSSSISLRPAGDERAFLHKSVYSLLRGLTAVARVATFAPQMDPKFLRNLRFAKKWNGKGRGAEDEE